MIKNHHQDCQQALLAVACPVCSASHLPVKGSLSNGVYASTCENCGHFFKFRAVQDVKTKATFTVNGLEYSVGHEYPPSTTLSTFLRRTGISKGTKTMCYEGGCGVCLVTVTLYDPVLEQKSHFTVNSCLMELFACDGMEITTIEGLGDAKRGYHPIQTQLADHDGSQCGYCSPAQVMNMYGLLKTIPKPTVQQIEDHFDATICRCTGYRPILDAMKTFAVDAPPHLRRTPIDIEDLDAKLCKKTGNRCAGHCHANRSKSDGCSNQMQRPLHIVSSEARWLTPVTLHELCEMVGNYAKDNYRLVHGNTAAGVYPQYSTTKYDILIDTRKVQELYRIDFDSVITLGANISLSTLYDLFAAAQADHSMPYAPAFAEHIKYIAATGIRNMACWAGNVMLKKMEPSFVSDIFLLLDSVAAKLIIYDKDGNYTEVTMDNFLKMDMTGQVIGAMVLPRYNTQDMYIRSYKRNLRLQQCIAYVNAAFNFELDANSNYHIKSKPSLLFGGISSQKIRASATEQLLIGKSLGDLNVLKEAFQSLDKELVPDASVTNAAYKKSLALSLFYKFVLDVCKVKASSSYVSGGTGLTRTPIVGTQDYGTTRPEEYPVTKPMPKLTAKVLTSGAAQYTPDLDGPPGTLFAWPVLSTIASGTLDTMDPAAALSVPGVVAFLTAADIPAGGVNNWRPTGLYSIPEELLCSGPINYAGQPLGIIVADTRETAIAAADKVKVTYKDVKTPIVTIEDAIKKGSYHPNPPAPWTVGDAKGAIAGAPHKVSGQVECGEQYHFHMETQASLCCPTDEGGMDVVGTTQWLDGVIGAVAQVIGLQQSEVTVSTKRIGGGFGGKISQNFLISGLCALASGVLGLPVKMHLDIHTNIKMCGKRVPYRMLYSVGFDDDGKLLGIDADIYADQGFSTAEGNMSDIHKWFDNAYFCANWLITPKPLKTNKPLGVSCRAPGSTPAVFFIESIMEHVAQYIHKDELSVRQSNLYVNGQSTITGRVLKYCTLRDVVAQHITDINYSQRKEQIAIFNYNNRWKKRGISVMPSMFGIDWSKGFFTTQLIVYHGDGSVAIAHGGIDMGQGINTKATQVCAYELNIPMEKISVKKSYTTNNANSRKSAASITSELVCKGVMACCAILQARMAPVKAQMDNPTWQELVAKCYDEQIDLTASYMTHSSDTDFHYMCFSVASVEAELDVLTGQYQFTEMDMLYDCGDSMNPELDVGQAEGAFLMGMGYHLTEEITYDKQSGEVINFTTGNYKAPMAKDLPMKYNIKFQRNVPNPIGVLRSKAVAEPALVMSAAALLAVKHAVEAARSDAGHSEFFTLDSPATPARVQPLCLNTTDMYTFGK